MNVDYWEKEPGNSPVLEYMGNEEPKAAVKLQKVIDLFEQKGLALLQSPFLEKLRGYDLYVLRVRTCKSFYRIFIVIKQSNAWLVHMFKKKTNNTPDREIQIALGRKLLIESQIA